ncbi:hypothetical protein HU200_045620 [Digitaria exilis]|uniref:Homeobox domain-containing protein n=1 Tax=Digitaria exilis TaxID=1010633 RepID=A0A835AZQ8_9POAL|nr:hypothetical protein HU200_045620 [Digitaria exilis]CAB3459010.1 unnamed protein product [Digitaria exilis]
MDPEQQAAAEPVRSRWTPKPEQILILESIFNSGMVNPPKDETVRIRKLLERFGAVGDANVFYWFQNRRSRSRRRQRQLQAQAAAAVAAGSSSSSSGSSGGGGHGGLTPGHAGSSSVGMFAHGGAAAYGGSPSSCASWPPSSAGIMGDLDCGGGGDDLFAISRQMGYADGGGSGSSASAAAAVSQQHQQQQQLYYSCQPGERQAMPCMHVLPRNLLHGSILTVFINGVATEVPRGPIDLRSMFGQDVVLVHSTGGLLPVNEYGVLMQSLQMGESYFLLAGVIELDLTWNKRRRVCVMEIEATEIQAGMPQAVGGTMDVGALTAPPTKRSTPRNFCFCLVLDLLPPPPAASPISGRRAEAYWPSNPSLPSRDND